jgi:flagellar L-ring protein precursor FlgH
MNKTSVVTRRGGELALLPGVVELEGCSGAGGREPSVARFAVLTAAGLMLLAAVSLSAQDVRKAGSTTPPPPVVKPLVTGAHVASNSLQEYLERVRATTTTDRAATGSIWSDSGRFSRMTTDVRAMRPNDLISVVVSESVAAETDGTVKNSRSSSASSQISALIGLLHAGNAMQNLLNQNSAAALNAQGQSATNSSLSTTFGGQVIDVLPNGMLVIEAAREVEFSQQTQTILLRGLVRPEDISQQNQVLSTAISSLELEVRGKGIINDYTRRQNPLVRFLEKILVF